MAYSKNEKIKESIHKKLDEFVSRAETLEKYLIKLRDTEQQQNDTEPLLQEKKHYERYFFLFFIFIFLEKM